MSLQIDVTKGYYWYYINNINVQYCKYLNKVYNVVYTFFIFYFSSKG